MMETPSVPVLDDYEERTIQTRPRISVVTTVWNGERSLRRTIDSVRAQHLPGLEYLIIDAGSRDATLDIIRESTDVVTFWKSEPDRGISDGFNKGIALSQGDYVALLNADDWLSPGQLEQGVATLDKTGADFVFGDLLYHDSKGRALYRICGDPSYARRIGNVMPALNHPTVIVRRSAYERFGLFDLGLRVAMDYDLLLRFHRAGCIGVYEPRIEGHMTLEGASDKQSRRGLAEVRDIAIRHGGWPPREWLRYFFRLTKGEIRRPLQHVLPAPLFERLRGRINRDFAGLPR
jgi:glycosyltransferase involved in cell wall biosynthesis